MTDRFYPVGLSGDKDMWKTTYEVQNEMRAFERSAYPPGCAVHQPGAREKFGFSTPGPIAHRLAKPELCNVEDVDIEGPRSHYAIPRYQVPDDREVFETFDVPEMQRSYQSPVATMSLSQGLKSNMSRSVSLPAIQTKTVSKLRQPNTAINKLEDDQFTYFVPKANARDGKERLQASNLSKLQKQNRLTFPQGDGTGFRTQSAFCEWYPSGEEHQVPTSYQHAFMRPPFYRISPLRGTGEL
jgi:hypothetical protein